MKKFDLQLFAEDNNSTTPAAESAEAVTEQEKTTTEKEPAPTAKPKESEEKVFTHAEFDRLFGQKYAELEKKKQKEIDEARRLAEMSAQEKAEYELKREREAHAATQKKLDELEKQSSLVEMSKTARKMLAENGITVSDELLGMLVTTDADETKAAIDGFSKAFTDAVESAVKDRLRGETPRVGTGKPAGSVSEIDKRIKKYE